MTNTKLVEKLRTLVEMTSTPDKKHIKKLRKILRKLKEQHATLKASLEGLESGQERSRIEQDIEVITLQRKKGLERYKQLKSDQKKAKKDTN